MISAYCQASGLCFACAEKRCEHWCHDITGYPGDETIAEPLRDFDPDTGRGPEDDWLGD